MIIKCPKCAAGKDLVVKYGYYVRKSDSKKISRFCCNSCNKHFSSATFNPCYNQKKRRLNYPIFKFFVSAGSQRRAARLLNCSRLTVKRKFEFLAKMARLDQIEWIKEQSLEFNSVYLDDLETFEHTKCKPVTVTMVVEKKTRKIIDYTVAQIPAKGHLVKIARKKYKYRRDESREKRRELFQRLQSVLPREVYFESDQHLDYPIVIKKYFPEAVHETHSRVEGAITGQGELKKIAWDPLFAINHTFAMLRANVNRLVRRTWCTTKKLSALDDHIAIYVQYHNRVLTEPRENMLLENILD